MDKSGKHIDFELIARHLSGETNQEEKQHLNTWLEAVEENRSLFEEYRSLWEKMDRVSSIAGLDIDAEWKHLESCMEKTTTGHVIRKGKDQAITRPAMFMVSRLAVAATVVLMLVFGGLYTSRNIGNKTLSTVDFSEELILPDGSTVTLNRNSILTYPKKFKKDQRGISLEGEGFFEVIGNSDWPFVITTTEVSVKVLGTSFNVNAYETNEEIEVIVKTGKVAVTRHGEVPQTIVLKPGNKAVYNKTSEDLSLSTKIDQNYMAWKTRSFVFKDQSLDEVATALNKVYGSEISISSDSLKAAKITTSFNDQPLEAILNVLAETLDLECVEYNGRILLKESN